MPVTISAAEWRIRRRPTKHAEQERWPVTPLLLGRIAKLAAMAAVEPRPADPEPRGTGGGRKGAVRRAVRPPERLKPPSAPPASPEGSRAPQGASEGFGGGE